MQVQITAPSTQWVATHPWGAQHPSVIVADTRGDEYLADVEYSDGQVTVRFSRAMAGTIDLFQNRTVFVAQTAGAIGRSPAKGSIGSVTKGAMA